MDVTSYALLRLFNGRKHRVERVEIISVRVSMRVLVSGPLGGRSIAIVPPTDRIVYQSCFIVGSTKEEK